MNSTDLIVSEFYGIYNQGTKFLYNMAVCIFLLFMFLPYLGGCSFVLPDMQLMSTA